MRKALVCSLLIAGLISVPGCRSRKAVPPPQPAPEPVIAAAEPEVAVVPDDRDFVQPAAEPDVLSSDIAEANRMARERGWIRDAFFAYDSSVLDADAEAALTASARWLRERPELIIRVEGHCDDRGTEQYNLALGERRAEIAAAYLVALGVDRGRIQTVSYGEERPFEEGSSEAAHAQNRRAHLALSGRR